MEEIIIKNKNITKAFSLLFVVVMLLSIAPFGSLGKMFVTTASGEEFTEGLYTYSVYKGCAEIIYADETISGDVTIPSKLGGYPVTIIGCQAFRRCFGITSISIPDSVSSIEGWAFDYCYRLADVTIPNSVVKIGNGAFSDCESLSEITVPNSVTHIGDWAFSYCYSLSEITIPSSVTHIGDWVFRGCEQLSSIFVDNDNLNFSSVDGVLFNKNKTRLIQYPMGKTEDENSYNIPNTVTDIGCGTFRGCVSLKDIFIPNGVVNIEDYAFSVCCFKSITIPDSVTKIGEACINLCSKLTTITLPSNLESIGHYAFSSCFLLKDITIPNSVTYIGDKAFECCDKLTSINVENENPNYSSEYGILFNKDKTTLIFCPKGTELTSYTIPDSVIRIESLAFAYCDSLVEITVPDTVKRIGKEAFYGCGYYDEETNWDGYVLYMGNHLIEAFEYISGDYSIREGTLTIADCAFEDCDETTNIVIPDSVTSIGEYAFFFCNFRDNLILPNSLTYIGDWAFEKCSGIRNVYIPSSVAYIGSGAFVNCIGVKSFVVEEGNPNYSSEDGILFNKDKTKLIQFPPNDERTSYTIPGSVTHIGNAAFVRSDLIEITIPNNVVEIGSSAFSECYDLMTIDIAGSVTKIGAYAFESSGYCWNDFNWEDGVLYIGNYLITSHYSFDDRDYAVKDGTKTIADGAFHSCDNLRRVSIPNSVTNIGKDVFAYSDNLSSISIAHSVTNIGKGAFSECDLLKDVYFGVQEEKWKEITIGEDNEKLTGANIHFADYTNAKLPANEVKKANYKNKIKFKITATGIPEGGFLTVDGEKFAPDATGTATFEKEFQVKETTIIKAHISDENDNFKVTAKDYTIKVDSYFFAKVKSFFTDFLFNWFKWKEVEFEFK